MKRLSEVFIGEALANFVVNSAWENIGDDVRHEAKRSLLNFVGTAIGSAKMAGTLAAVEICLLFSGKQEASLFGRPEKVDILSASFLNAISGNLLDYDDTHPQTIMHPSAPVAPAILALAEQRQYSGQDVLEAFVIGVDVACRIGNSVSPGHYAKGWHITATCGIFGAAAASAKLLKLSAEQTWHALGIAASQSAGLAENLPSGAKNVGVGNSARNGLFAALLAEKGYTASPAALEGPQGWAHAIGAAPLDEQALFTDLGRVWEVSKNTYKLYPCGIVFHSVIDACLELRKNPDFDISKISRIVVSGDRLLLARGNRSVENERDARVSIHHCAAIALIFGAAGVLEFSDEIVSASNVRHVRTLVEAKLDESLPTGASKVTVTTTESKIFEATVMHPKGSSERPLTDKEIETKILDIAQYSGAKADISKIIQTIWNLDKLATIEGLTQANC